jgi:hypothetical protein
LSSIHCLDGLGVLPAIEAVFAVQWLKQHIESIKVTGCRSEMG